MDLGTTPAGMVGVFVKNAGCDDQDGGRLVLLHSVCRHGGEYGYVNRGKVFAYIGDVVVGAQPDCLVVSTAAFLSGG